MLIDTVQWLGSCNVTEVYNEMNLQYWLYILFLCEVLHFTSCVKYKQKCQKPASESSENHELIFSLGILGTEEIFMVNTLLITSFSKFKLKFILSYGTEDNNVKPWVFHQNFLDPSLTQCTPCTLTSCILTNRMWNQHSKCAFHHS